MQRGDIEWFRWFFTVLSRPIVTRVQYWLYCLEKNLHTKAFFNLVFVGLVSQAHCRAPHRRALHGDAPAGEPPRLSRRVPAHLVGATRDFAHSDLAAGIVTELLGPDIDVFQTQFILQQNLTILITGLPLHNETK